MKQNMKKAIITLGLFSLVVFTSTAAVGDTGGNQSTGGNKKSDDGFRTPSSGNQSAGGNKKVDVSSFTQVSLSMNTGNQSTGHNVIVE